jgi:RluA family pseudouridine synthase
MTQDHTVSPDQAGRHLRSLLEEVLPNIPAKGIRRAIQRGQILVNKSRVSSNYQTVSGDHISIHIQTTTRRRPKIDIPIVFEDDQLAVINKPAGLNVGGGRSVSVSDYLPHILKVSSAEDALPLPRSVHRLDKPTSGLLLVAKTKSSLAKLSQQFEKHTVIKIYTASVSGTIKTEGIIDIQLEDKTAYTEYKPLENISSEKSETTIVHLFPKTGRTHQLRKHMAYIGHPIIGDFKYGKNNLSNAAQLMLCATNLTFTHPVSNDQININIDLPPHFTKTINP